MNTLLNLFLITLVICFVVDCSGIMTDIRKLVANIIYKKTKMKVDPNELKMKPIGCSLCLTWWTGIIYLLCIGEFTLVNFTFVALLALVSSNISGMLLTFKDFLSTLETKLNEIIYKINKS